MLGSQTFCALESTTCWQKTTLCPILAYFVLLTKALKERLHDSGSNLQSVASLIGEVTGLREEEAFAIFL